MRPSLFPCLLVVLAFACGSPVRSDAGVDAGGDAGLDAGPPPVCLEDQVDAGARDGGADAGVDLSCAGQALPPSGQAELVLTGKVTRAAFIREPLAGVTVELLSASGEVVASTQSSSDGGQYALSLAAGCVAFDGRLRATAPADAGYSVTWALPARPWRQDTTTELVMFNESAQGLAAALANVTLVPGASAVAVDVLDCAGTPIEGAVVSTGGVGELRYVGPAGVPTQTLSATGPSGELVVFNVPAGSLTVTATLGAQEVGRKTLEVPVGVVYGTRLVP